MKDVTAPVPRPQKTEPRVLAEHAVRSVVLTLVGGFFLILALLYLNAMLGFLFQHAAWALVLAFFGYPLVRLMHAAGVWVSRNAHL